MRSITAPAVVAARHFESRFDELRPLFGQIGRDPTALHPRHLDVFWIVVIRADPKGRLVAVDLHGFDFERIEVIEWVLSAFGLDGRGVFHYLRTRCSEKLLRVDRTETGNGGDLT